MDGLCAKILVNYEIDVKNIKKTKGYYIINTADGAYALRKTPDTTDRIEFRLRLQKNFLSNDYKNIEKIYATTEGNPFVLHEEQKYILTDYLSGEEVRFDDKKELSKILEALSCFHKKSRGLNMVPNEFYSEHMGNRLKKMLEEIRAFKKKINFSKGLSDFDLIFLKNYDYYENNIHKAMEIVDKTNYNEKLKVAFSEKSICHNLLKKEAFAIKEGSVLFSSLSGCLVDHFTSDVAMIIIKYMKYDPERRISIVEIIDMYGDSGHNKLNNDDYNIILARLLMPTGFLNAASQYYIKKRSWAPSAVTGDLQYEINSIESFCKYIEPLFSTLI